METIDYKIINFEKTLIHCKFCGSFLHKIFNSERYYCEHCNNTFTVNEIGEEKGNDNTINFEKMSGIEFEKFCIKILEKLSFKNVRNTKIIADFGVDILAEKNGMKYAFQCKRYEGTVSNSAIQEVYSGKAYYDCDECGVITNSIFTESAYKTASKLNVVLIDKNLLKLLI